MGIAFVKGRVVSDKPTKYNLPVLRVNNSCGDCKACCTVLAIEHSDKWPDPDKPAGVPCKHLCENGCGIWQQAEFPPLCKTYYCEWRDTRWLGEQVKMRPDKCGAILQDHNDLLAVFETFKGGAYTPEVVAAVKKYSLKYKGEWECLRINVYPYEGYAWAMKIIDGVMREEAGWYYHETPYEHYVLDKADKSRRVKNSAKILLKWFDVRKHRQSFMIEDSDGKEIEVCRDKSPLLQQIAVTGVAPEDMKVLEKEIHDSRFAPD